MTDLEIYKQCAILKAWQDGMQCGLEGGPMPIYTLPNPDDDARIAWIDGMKTGRLLYRQKYNEVFKVKQ